MPTITLRYESVLETQTAVLTEHNNLKNSLQPLLEWLATSASFQEIESFIEQRGGNHQPYEQQLVQRLFNHVSDLAIGAVIPPDVSMYDFLLDDYERSFDDTVMVNSLVSQFNNTENGVITIQAATSHQLRSLPLNFPLTFKDIEHSYQEANLIHMDLTMSLHPFTKWLENSASLDQISEVNDILSVTSFDIDPERLSLTSKTRPCDDKFNIEDHASMLKEYDQSLKNVDFWSGLYQNTNDSCALKFKDIFN